MNDYDVPTKRPVSGTVFGILSLVVAGISLIATIYSVITNIIVPTQRVMLEEIFANNTLAMIWYWLGGLLALGMTVWLAAVGYGLLTDQVWARKQAITYASADIIYLIITTPITYVLIVTPTVEIAARDLPPEAQQFASIGGFGAMACGTIFWLIFPVLMIYFMVQPALKEWYDIAGDPYGTSPSDLN